jgi:hypothetical protein
MVWRIIQLLISVGLIIGGLSGELVLLGTNSSIALVIAGVIWLLNDIYQIATYKKGISDKDAFQADGQKMSISKAVEIAAAREKSRTLTESAEIIVTNEETEQENYRFLFNNNEFIKGVPPGGSVTITANQSVNVLCAKVEKYDEQDSVFIVVDISEGETKKVSYINNHFVLK